MIPKHKLEQAVAQSHTYSEVARELGISPVGGNITNLKRACNRYGIDVGHLVGKSWASGKTALVDSRINSKYTPNDVFTWGGKGPHKRILIQERGHLCEWCGVAEWNGAPVVLELDHIDGVRNNNTRENLRLLCPNCHSCTPTWRGRNAKNKQTVSDETLLVALAETGNVKRALELVGLAPKGTNYRKMKNLVIGSGDLDAIKLLPPLVDFAPFDKESLQALLWEMPLTHIGALFDMSDNGVARWVKKWGLVKPPRGHWLKQKYKQTNPGVV